MKKVRLLNVNIKGYRYVNMRCFEFLNNFGW